MGLIKADEVARKFMVFLPETNAAQEDAGGNG
jgi:hypothetical protein